MLYLACTTLSSVDLAQYGVSLAKDWVSVKCGTSYYAVTVSNKHEIKYGDDSILNIGQKFSSIHCVYRSHCYI